MIIEVNISIMFNLVLGTKNSTTQKDTWYGKFSIFPEDKVTHAISTRFGGFSKEPFNGLNLALHVGDNADDVIKNREQFCKGLQLDAKNMTTCQQVHGNNIACITEEYIGAGAFSMDNTILDTDALITNVKNVPLSLFFADCTPILIYDPVQHVIGAAHGGWRGTVSSIAFFTVRKMQKEFGTKAYDCLASIGPSIGACCYEIGDEVAAQFEEVFRDCSSLILKRNAKTNKYHLDLWTANALMLQRAGLYPENIDVANVCTCCNSDIFFSYRADKGKTGRITATIALK